MRSFWDAGGIGRQVRLFGPLRLEFANFLSHFLRVSGFRKFRSFCLSKFRSFGVSEFRKFRSFGVSEFRKFRSFRTFEAPKVGRDICRDLGRSRLERANFLSPDAQFRRFRLDRPPSAPFRPGKQFAGFQRTLRPASPPPTPTLLSTLVGFTSRNY